jgi:hypothetical protein
MDLKKENEELKAKLSVYEADAAAEFYKTLVGAIKDIETKVKSKTLNFDEDSFAKSILVLADKSGKIFEGLKQGKESFTQSNANTTDIKASKSKTIAI